jgi:uncharacterized protein (TIGR04255 family)
MSPSYRNPPIKEVICEFSFWDHKDWDLTYTGLVYDQVKETFPNRRTRLHLQQSSEKDMATSFYPEMPVSELAQFWTDDETTLMQLGINYLSINRLEPYRSWEEFKPFIYAALHGYSEVIKPVMMLRLGLRYVNKIVVPDQAIYVNDYFLMYAPVPIIPNITHDDLRGTTKVDSFSITMDIPTREDNDILRVRLSKSEPNEFILDLDYFLRSHRILAIDSVDEWLENAHTSIESGFESVITERTRWLFDPINYEAMG